MKLIIILKKDRAWTMSMDEILNQVYENCIIDEKMKSEIIGNVLRKLRALYKNTKQ